MSKANRTKKLRPSIGHCADPLSGVFAIVQCADQSCLVTNTHVGLSADNNGTAYPYDGFGLIRLDDSLRGRDYTRVTLHEFMHLFSPRWDESTVKECTDQIADLLYVPEVRKRGALDV